MNKLKWNIEELGKDKEELELKDNTKYIILGTRKVKRLKIKENTHNIQIVLENNSSLQCGTTLDIENIHLKLEIINKENSTLLLQLGIKAKAKNELIIINNLEENNINSQIKIRVMGEKNSHTVLKATGVIKENTKKNEFLEDMKYLSEENIFIECLPEILVSSKDANVNHFLTIGTIKESDIFYLKSKGIEEEKAKNLIRECFIKSMEIREEG